MKNQYKADELRKWVQTVVGPAAKVVVVSWDESAESGSFDPPATHVHVQNRLMEMQICLDGEVYASGYTRDDVGSDFTTIQHEGRGRYKRFAGDLTLWLREIQ